MQLPESATGTVEKKTTSTQTTTTTTIRNKLSESDPYLIDRIVGYHEYSKALHYFDRLAAKCSPYELEAIDEIVKSDPQFAIYTVPSKTDRKQATRRVRQANAKAAEKAGEKAAVTTKKKANANGSAIAYGSSQAERKKHGFKWMTALARVEVGAMYAGFSKNPRPFAPALSPGYDIAEFRTLLAESARLHYWSLRNDTQFQALTKRFQPNSLTLAYLRRLNIATAFSIASGQTSRRNELPRFTEMSKYAADLSTTRKKLQLSIEQYLAQVQVASSTSQPRETSSELTLTELCNGAVCQQFDSD